MDGDHHNHAKFGRGGRRFRWANVRLAAATAPAPRWGFTGAAKKTAVRSTACLLQLRSAHASTCSRVAYLLGGVGADPDAEGADGLSRLFVIYKPRGLDLADPSWTLELAAARPQFERRS